MAAKVKWPDDYNPWQESRSYLNHCSVPALALEEEEEVAACLQVESYSDQMAASRVDSSYSAKIKFTQPTNKNLEEALDWILEK